MQCRCCSPQLDEYLALLMSHYCNGFLVRKVQWSATSDKCLEPALLFCCMWYQKSGRCIIA